MKEVKESGEFRDMLDIIYDNRNKAYGAYQLRREYPEALVRAFFLGLLLIALALILPAILKAVNPVLPDERNDVVARISDEPVIDLDKPVPPPPVPPTPPPPTRSMDKFVPPIVKVDDEVTNEHTPAIDDLTDTDKDIGTSDQQGTDEAPPAIDETPDDLGGVIEQPVVKTDITYEITDIQKPPSYPGGDKELFKYLAANIKYPALARENNLQGRVTLTFVVNKDGRISDVTILKDPIGGGCGKEALRVVSEMPRWIPGEANGNPVKVRYTIPVLFRLE